MDASGMSGASALSSSSMLIENDRKTLAACWQNVDWETHHWTLITVVFTLRPAPVPIIPVPLAAIFTVSTTRSELWVAMKVRLRVARRYTHTMHLRRDAEQGGT